MSSPPAHASLAAIPFVTMLAIAGCRDAGSTDLVRDSAGIRIIEHASDEPAERWHVDSQPRLRIGAADGDEAQQLFNVAGVARLADGRIVIANGGSSDMRVFAADGRHLRTTGRSGGGPGEFRRILRMMRMPGDSLLVLDPMSARLSVLDDSGRFVRSFPIGRLPQGQPTVRARFPDGRLLGFMLGHDPIAHPGLHLQRAMFLLLSDSGTVVDSIGQLLVYEGEARVSAGRETVSYWPFHASGFVGVSGDDVVYVWGRSSEIHVLSSSGAVERIVRLRARAKEFTEEMRREEGERMSQTRAPTLRPLFLRDWGGMGFPDSLPIFAAMVIDGDGSLWLLEHELGDPPERRWLVVDREGQLRADIVLPGRLRVFEIGSDYVLGTMRDDLDVESVVLLDLSRGST